MDHDRARESFTTYHDGDLSAAEAETFEEHLEHCEECRAEWEAYQRTVGEISGLHNLAPPSDFIQNVEQTIWRRSRGRFFGDQRSFSMQFAIVSFILIILFMLAYLVLTTATEIEIVEEPGSAGEEPIAPEKGETGK